MTTRMLRRGLPRVPGGEPWPPADAAGIDEPVGAEMLAAPAAASAAPETPVAEASPAAAPASTPPPAATTAEAFASATTTAEPVASVPASAAGSTATGMRRGLPRVAGGEPWPPAGLSSSGSATGENSSSAGASAEVASAQRPAAPPAPAPVAHAPAATGSSATATVAPAAQHTPPSETMMRRGLPRVVGGEPWPPAGTRPARAANPAVASAAAVADAGTALSEPAAASTSSVASGPAAAASNDLVPAAAPAAILTADIGTPLPWTRTVWDGRAPRHVTAAARDSGRLRPTWTQATAGLLAAAGLGIVAAAAVAFVRALLSFPFMQDFLVAFPGEYHPAIEVAPGFAPWVGWQHFFNAFLIVLIIRSGLRVRTEKRPTVFWTPRGNNKGKISLTLWFHQALDILWLVNGVIFVVLIFVTGHWVRIVPTSWEVLPNALSAALQYVSLDWPTENGWVNYNSLQQLAYFATVFIAAPLAAITGFRMSGMWPKKAEKLSRAYPVEWARALHFPVMLYFVAFIVVHVALVMFTGFLRNLNHMYASQDAVTWTGFWVFTASVVVMIAAWVAARPLVLAPIAKLFGSVSGR